MWWDFSYAIPSLLVLVVIAGYYFALPRVPIRINRVFLYLLFTELLVIMADIISSWVDMNYDVFPLGIVHFVNVAYFSLFYLRAYFFFFFTVTVLRLVSANRILLNGIFQIPAFIGILFSILSPFTGWLYTIEGDGFHAGPLYNSLYLVFWLYIVFSYSTFFSPNYRQKRDREKTSLLFYNLILLIGTIVRLIMPQYLLMDTFCLLSLLIIYLSFENPDFYLEGRNRIFNSKALREYLEEESTQKSFKIFALVVRNYREMREIYGTTQMDLGLGLISAYLKREYSGLICFYYRSGRFILLSENEIDKDEILFKVRERFKSPWSSDNAELYLEAGFAYMDFGKLRTSADVILNLIGESLAKVNSNDENDFINISEKDLVSSEKNTEAKRNLEYAIDHDKVEVFLQPIVDVRSQKMIGAEALSRIRDVNGHIIPPGVFIPIAERNGRVNQLGEQVFEKTCKFISENDLDKLGIRWINVNLSPIQFMRVDLKDRLRAIIEKYQIDPEKIHLEITEEVMIDENLLQKQIQGLKEIGFYFVLDDYGRGYSNLSRLKKCPFINVKLDMSLVWEYDREPDAMLPNAIETFKNMGFSVTAEGIENENMAKKMMAIGCDFLQGYFYSKPLPMDEFIQKYSIK